MNHQIEAATARIPSLSDTEEILKQVTPNWEIKLPTTELSRSSIDNTLLEWVSFFDRAREGYKVQKNLDAGTILGDEIDFQAYLAVEHALGEEEKYPEILIKLQSASAQLLSNEGLKVIKARKQKLKAINVDEELKGKINNMVKKMDEIDGVSLPLTKLGDDILGIF
jgi:hypothetical protein